MTRCFSSLNRRVPESGEGLSLRRSTRRLQHPKHRSRVRSYLVFKSTECSVAHRGRRSCSLSCNAPAGGFRVCGLQRGKGKEEGVAAALIVGAADAATMRWHVLAEEGEAEAGAFLLFAPAAPEPFENVLSILWRNAAAAIGHLNPAGAVDRHGHFGSSRRVNDR